MEKASSRWFNEHPKIAIAAAIVIIFVLGAVLFEFALSYIGLGDPVLFRSYPLYGFRPLPNQEVERFNAVTKVNNLGLRANEDWDDEIRNKILFLGDSVAYGGTRISNDELFSTLAVKNLDGCATSAVDG